ncbi:WG repeat-containing protein [Clostridium senegalense]
MKLKKIFITFFFIFSITLLYGCENKNFNFENAFDFKDGVARVETNKKFGYINKEGNFIINPKYEDALDFSNKFAWVKKDNLWGCIDKNDNTILNFEYEDVIPTYEDNSLIVKQDNKLGLFYDGEITIFPMFDEITPNINPDVLIVNDGSKLGLFTYTGDTILDPIYSDISFKSNLVCFMVDNKYGILNLNTKEKLESLSDTPLTFIDNISTFSSNGKYGYINADGNVLIEPKFENALYFNSCNLASVKLNNKWGVINKSGDFIVEPKYEEIVYNESSDYDFKDKSNSSTFLIKLNNKWGLLDSYGKELLEPTFNYATPLNNETFAISENSSMWALADTKGTILSDFKYNSLHSISDKFTCAQIKEKNTIVNLNGLEVLKPEYNSVYFFNNNFIIEKDGKTGYISNDGKEILPIKYDELNSSPEFLLPENYDTTIEEFYSSYIELYNQQLNNYIYIKLDNKFGVCNKDGKIIIEPKYSRIKYLNKNYLAVLEDNLWGILDINGNVIITPKFNDIGKFNADLVPVKVDNHWRYVDLKDNFVI